MLRLRVKQAMADAVAIGRVWRYRAGAYAPSGRVVPSGERPAEQSRFDAAVAAAEGELEKLAAANEIFAAHLELAADPMLMENVAEKIAEGMTAADAVHAASGELAALFAQIDDEYLRARATMYATYVAASCGSWCLPRPILSPRFPTGASSPPTNWHRRIRRGSIFRACAAW